MKKLSYLLLLCLFVQSALWMRSTNQRAQLLDDCRKYESACSAFRSAADRQDKAFQKLSIETEKVQSIAAEAIRLLKECQERTHQNAVYFQFPPATNQPGI